MNTSIIIVNYNAGELLENCILSVLKSDFDDFEVILVDNASTDQSHIICKEKFPNITLIENKENLGFCEGNNVGFRYAKGDFIVLLNPDTEVESNWLKELHKAYEIHGEGLYQAKLMNLEDKIRFDSAGNMLTLFGFLYIRGLNEKDQGQFEEIEKVGFPSGACLFTSRTTLKKLDHFDPYLFAFYEDISLAWRAALIEIKSYYVPKSIVFHKSGHSFKKGEKKIYLMQRNRWYCLLTLYSRKTFYRIFPSLILLEIIVFFYYLLAGMAKGKILAYRDIIKDRKLLNQRYKDIQKNRKISDKEIINNFLYLPSFKIPKAGSSRIFYYLDKALKKISFL